MSRLERLKEELAYEKQALFLLFAAGLGTAGWLFSHFRELSAASLYLIVFALTADALLVAALHRRIKSKFDEIEKL